MNLKEIAEDRCPLCGSEAIAETSDHKHTNGHYNESRTFECGLKLEFSPNSMRTSVATYYPCSNDPKLTLRHNKRKEAARKLRTYVSRMDADNAFKDYLLDDLDYKVGRK